MNRIRNLVFRGAMCLCAVSLMVLSLHAQSSATGALEVTAIDSTGAVIAGATVSVSNSAGLSRTQTTDSSGSSTFTLLPVGNYHVSISATGFATVDLTDVAIEVTETRTLRQTLAIGQVSQKVTVEAETQTIQTSSAALGNVVNNESINELPLVSRNYMQILTMSSGAGADVVNAATVGHGTPQIYVNGMANTGNNFQMDGAEINSIASGTGQDTAATTFGSTAIPSPDAIQEFKVQTAQYDASYGRNAGGNVNVVTKSGTDQIHGSAFEYVRNDMFNANDFFRNHNGLDRAELKQNQFGATVGGPIVKDKLFYFMSYQGTRQVDGLDTSATSSVTLPPQLTDTNRTAAALGAAFCPGNNPAGSQWANVYNPTPSIPTPATDKVACNGSNINPIALQLLNTKVGGAFIIPSPQIIINPGTANALGNSVFSVPAVYNDNQGMVNVDYILSPKETISARTFYAYSPEVLGLTANQPPGTAGDYYLTGNDNALLRLTSVITNNLVNEAHGAVSYIRAHDQPNNPLSVTQLGITPAQNFLLSLPVITVGSPAEFALGGSTTAGKPQDQTTYQAEDQLSWVHGAHTVRVGFQQNRLSWFYGDTGQSRGAFTFRTFADFLLGMTAVQNGTSAAGLPDLSNLYSSSSGALGVPPPQGLLHGNESAAFVQDDWKVNSRLTLNVGLRWEYDGLMFNVNGNTQEAWLSLFQSLPIPPASGTYVGLTMPKNYPGTLPAGIFRRDGNAQDENGSPYNDFAPRFGLAWQPFGATSKLVVRTGYGWFYSILDQQEVAQSAILAPPLAEVLSLSGSLNSTATFATPFPPPPPSPPGFTPYLRTPTSKLSYQSGIYQHLVVPLVQVYNLNLQYALPGSMLLEVGYVGNRGEHLGTLEAFNIPTLATPTAPVNCAAPSGCVTTNTSANAASRVPILGVVPGGLKFQGNFGDSSYNSVQASLRKQLAKGLQFQVAYTFSKTLTDFEGTAMALRTSGGDIDSNDPTDPAQERGPAEFSRPQRLTVSYLYQFPSLGTKSRVFETLTSGWNVSGVTTAQDGDPLTITDTSGGAAYGSVATSRAQFCPGMGVANVLTPGSVESRINDYLNSAAFCSSPIVGAFPSPGPGLPASPGATGYGNSSRGSVLGPGQFDWDLSLSKKTRVGGIREDAALEFRAEFFNAFNHPQFTAPTTSLGPTFGIISSSSVAPRIIQLALRYSF